MLDMTVVKVLLFWAMVLRHLTVAVKIARRKCVAMKASSSDAFYNVGTGPHIAKDLATSARTLLPLQLTMPSCQATLVTDRFLKKQ